MSKSTQIDADWRLQARRFPTPERPSPSGGGRQGWGLPKRPRDCSRPWARVDAVAMRLRCGCPAVGRKDQHRPLVWGAAGYDVGHRVRMV